MFRIISGSPSTIWHKELDHGEALIRAQHLSLEWPGVYFEVRHGEGYGYRVTGYMHGNVSAPPVSLS